VYVIVAVPVVAPPVMVLSLVMAIVPSDDVQAPPVGDTWRTVDAPEQTVEVPVIAPGIALTVTL
jgi:hypothetical protein